MASDLAHFYGQDLNVAASGDLLAVDGVTKGTQRVLRRLLTNPLGYIFEPTYGAGLPAKIGQPISGNAITALIRAQMLLESAVARTPAPIIIVSQSGSGFFVQIQYADGDSGETVPLSFTVTPPAN